MVFPQSPTTTTRDGCPISSKTTQTWHHTVICVQEQRNSPFAVLLSCTSLPSQVCGPSIYNANHATPKSTPPLQLQYPKRNRSSSHPCPTCCTSHGGAINTVSRLHHTVKPRKSCGIFASHQTAAQKHGIPRTLGRLTSGMTTTLIALGASLGGAVGSPPGW